MISNFSSFVELFAAIYVTMAVNNDFCSNFWTPQYYKDMKALLNIYHFNGSSSMHDKLLAEIKLKYNIVQENAHHRGFILLILCIFYLIFMGFETEENSMLVEHYVPLLYCTVLVGCAVILSNVVLKNWRRVMSFVVICMVVYIMLKSNNLYQINTLMLSGFLYKYKSFLMIAVILLPVVYQIYIYWLYSSIYKGYLKYHVKIEYDRFRDSMEGIKNKEKGKVNKIYLDVWTDTNFSSDEDPTLTPFYNKLNEQLLYVASPTHFQLLLSWLKHQSRCIINRFKQKKYSGKRETERNKPDNQLAQYEAQNEEILDFKNEYDDYCQWKKTAGKNNNIRAYCKVKGISVKDMIAWLRVNKPNNVKR